MYDVASRLTPDNYHRLARAVYGEMALAGHHRRRRVPLRPPPDATGRRTTTRTRWARHSSLQPPTVGIRLTLLDTCYLHGGLRGTGPIPLDEAQLRFGDGTAERWAERASALGNGERVRIGAAVHSVRAVDPTSIAVVADWAEMRGAPLHAHVSEQPAENETSLAAYGRTPVEVFEPALGPAFTAVHATHLTPSDISRLGSSTTTCCLCPTTERDLADGVARAADLRDAGSSLALGSDSHAVIDLFEEARAVELDERLISGSRGHHSPTDLATMATAAGHRCARAGPRAVVSRRARPPTSSPSRSTRYDLPAPHDATSSPP